MESYNDNLHKKSSPVLYEYAKQMRKDSTKAEEILWLRLKNRQLAGLKFRRQHPIDKFIADFYCHEKNLIIELDGNVHASYEQKDLDKGRTETLNEFGIRVFRFKNEEIIGNIEAVILQITKRVAKIDDKRINS